MSIDVTWLSNGVGFSSKNPLDGLSADEQFERVQWGNRPTKHTSIDVKHLKLRQDMVLMGKFRAMHVRLHDGSVIEIKASMPYPYLMFGADDNKLWIAGGSLPRMAKTFAFGRPGNTGDILRTDYESQKGERAVGGHKAKRIYYYHDHKSPYAVLRVHQDGYPEYVGGGYAVRPEGIVR